MTRRASRIVAVACLVAAPALAQNQDVPNTGNGTTGSGTTPSPPTAAPAPAPVITAVPVYPGAVAPPPPGQPLGGGNATESSARTVTGSETDTFDLAPGTGAAGTAYGDANGPIFLERGGRTPAPSGPPPAVHVVRRGDTLWDICAAYLGNPYAWPKVWSYNPQIQNPHWIYPNDRIRLRGGPEPAPPSSAPPRETVAHFPPSRGRGARGVGVVSLREQGFIAEDAKLDWGTIAGAPLDKMFLTDDDALYVQLDPGHAVKVGDELTVFRPVRDLPNGKVILLEGTVRVDAWNPETRLARARVTETLDTIERGARVGPIPRRFDVVPPVPNTANVRAHVLVGVHPRQFYNEGQVVFLDQGETAGLRSGNRLFLVRRGDPWRDTMQSERTADRVAIERDEPAVLERAPHVPREAFPEEVIGELRVLSVQKKSATAVVTASRVEIEPGDTAVARQGY